MEAPVLIVLGAAEGATGSADLKTPIAHGNSEPFRLQNAVRSRLNHPV
jgi:hypothetical protein